MENKFDYEKRYSGPIYLHTIKAELFNLKKDHAKITSLNPRKKYVDKPTAIGTVQVVTRAENIEELKRFPYSMNSIGKQLKKAYKGDELIVPLRIIKTIITNV